MSRRACLVQRELEDDGTWWWTRRCDVSRCSGRVVRRPSRASLIVIQRRTSSGRCLDGGGAATDRQQAKASGHCRPQSTRCIVCFCSAVRPEVEATRRPRSWARVTRCTASVVTHPPATVCRSICRQSDHHDVAECLSTTRHRIGSIARAAAASAYLWRLATPHLPQSHPLNNPVPSRASPPSPAYRHPSKPLPLG